MLTNNNENQGINFIHIQERKIFEGHWVNGKRTGHGKLSWQNGEEFTGEFQENLQTGQGEHKFPSGHYDIAGWDKGLRHGAATYFNPDMGKVSIDGSNLQPIKFLCISYQ